MIIMVMIMETRIDKLKRLNKERRYKRIKYLVVFLFLIFMFIGMILVNNEARQLDLLENPVLFKIDLKNNKLVILGEKYYLDFKILKKQI